MIDFQWDPSFSVDAPELNQEHQIIIGIMNKVRRENNGGQSNQILISLKQLYDYAQQHFQNEEAYMLAKHFPDLNKHKKVHQGLLDKLQHYIANFEISGALPDAFFSFLNAWVQTHMGKMDLEYSKAG